jgi:threonine dehydratase
MRYTRERVKVIGVEPERGASLTAALDAGGPVPIEPEATCADGLQPRFTGHISYEVCKSGPRPVLVGEEDLLYAVRYCMDELRLVVEPSGAAGVAALVSGKYVPGGEGKDRGLAGDGKSGGSTVVVVSGSNLDRKWLRKALEL